MYVFSHGQIQRFGQHLFTGIFFIWWYNQTWRKWKKQKLQWQQHRQDNNTRSQAGYTAQKFTPKICRTRNCPTLPLHWIVVTSHLTPRQIKQKVMGNYLFELFFFPINLISLLWIPINFPSNEFSFIGELFFWAGSNFRQNYTWFRTQFHKKLSDDCFITNSTGGTCDLPRCIATDPCNLLFGYTYLNLNSKVEKWIFGAWKNFKLSKGRPWWIFGCESVAVKQDETCQAEKPIK